MTQRLDDLSPAERRALLAELLRKKTAEPRTFPVSSAQRRLWFLHELLPDSPVYNVPIALRLSGPLDHATLRRSLDEIVQRHEVLRTTFHRNDDGPVQVVGPAHPVELPVTDLGHHGPDAEREAIRRANEEGRRPFDLSKGPLLRAALMRLSENEHLLLVTMHHIVAEPWSIAIFLRELETIHTAFQRGAPPRLPELPIQYSDYTLWQHEWLATDVVERERAYWRKRLSGRLEPLQLPTDHPRPAIQTYRGGWRSRRYGPSLTNALEALSRREGATLFMTLLAGFVSLLVRYTGREDIAIGAPVAGRNRSETEPLIGLFLNTLVLRVDASGDPSFRELLKRAREVLVGAMAHQELPFEQVVNEVRPERDLSHTPLFQVFLEMQNAPPPTLALGDRTVGRVLPPDDVHNGATKVDLSLMFEESPEALKAGVEYATDLFDPPTIDRMLGHLETLLSGATAAPDTPLSRLPLLTQAETHQILAEWSGQRTSYERDGTIPALFEKRVDEAPDAVALEFGDQRMTYGELDRRSNQLAHRLREIGVGPDVLVGLYVERSLELVVALLGILKAGGAYLPLDAAYPQDRLVFMIDDTRAPVILAQAHLRRRLPSGHGRVLTLDGADGALSGYPENRPSGGASPEHLAYAIYTSGSTGGPKGARIPHRAVIRLVRNTNYATFGADDVFLQLAPLSFDASTLEVWGPLLNGGRLVLCPPHTPSLAELGTIVQRRRVTTLWLTASLFHQMVEANLAGLRGVRQILAGGDVLSVGRVRKALQGLPGSCVINGYGPTENTTFTACCPMTDVSQLGETVPIGRPIANTRVYILDRHMNPVPAGVAGRLYAGGDGLARDYLDRPKLSAERFLPDPFSGEPGTRLYDTGDLARWLPDRGIEFLGRDDSQIKIRGFRVELGEIEATLLRHPCVGEAAVLAVMYGEDDKRLVAYVGQRGSRPTVEDLRSFAREHLPQYMVPSLFVVLNAMPLSPNGKVDRRALPAPSGLRPDVTSEYVAPKGELERSVAEIWRGLLKVDRVGLNDNFFDLGGHSLLLVQVQAELQQRLGKDVSMVDMFRYPTVSALARHLSDSEVADASTDRREGTPEGRSRLEALKRRRQARRPRS